MLLFTILQASSLFLMVSATSFLFLMSCPFLRPSILSVSNLYKFKILKKFVTHRKQKGFELTAFKI